MCKCRDLPWKCLQRSFFFTLTCNSFPVKKILVFFPLLLLFSCSGGGEAERSDSAVRADSANWYMNKGNRLTGQGIQERDKTDTLGLPDTTSRSGMLFTDARNAYLNAARLMPEEAKYWNLVGASYYLSRQYDKANFYIRKSLRLRPGYTQALFNLGMSFDQSGQLDSAVQTFQQCIQSDSAYLPAYERLSDVLMRKDLRAENAIAVLQAATRRNPSSDQPWNSLSRIYMMTQDTIHAVEALEKAAEINPSNTTRLYNLAVYFNSKKDTARYNRYSRILEEQKRRQGGQ